MANIVIPVRDEALKQEIIDCFTSKYQKSSESLTDEEHTIECISQYIVIILNNCRVDNAIQSAASSVTKETTID